MRPHSHALFAILVVVAVVLLFNLEVPLDLTLIVFAAFSGFLPDFDHRKWIWKIIAVFLFAFFTYFFAQSLEGSFAGSELAHYGFAVLCAAVLTWIVYKSEPLRAKVVPGPSSGTVFAVLYAVIVFAATWSVAYAFIAFFAYSSHWVLDKIAWETRLGRRLLIRTPDWRKPYEWHVAQEAKKTGRKIALPQASHAPHKY